MMTLTRCIDIDQWGDAAPAAASQAMYQATGLAGRRSMWCSEPRAVANPAIAISLLLSFSECY